MRAAFTWIAVVALPALLIGCGGGDAPMQRPSIPQRSAAPAKAPEAQAAGELANPKWDLIAEHFRGYARKPISTRKDVFHSNLDKYVEKVEIKDLAEKQEADEQTALPSARTTDLHPLKKHPADEYRLTMVMTGTGSPKAMILDPDSDSYIVERNSEVGNEGGVVEAITQYEVIIRQPNEPEPVRLSIQPEIFDVGKLQKKEREVHAAAD